MFVGCRSGNPFLLSPVARGLGVGFVAGAPTPVGNLPKGAALGSRPFLCYDSRMVYIVESTMKEANRYKPKNIFEMHGTHVYGTPEKEFAIYKIGSSQNPEKRLKQLFSEPMMTYPKGMKKNTMRLFHTIQTDKSEYLANWLRSKFALNRIQGDWFMLNEEDASFIKSIDEVKYF